MKHNDYPYRSVFASMSLLCLLLAGYLAYYHYPAQNTANISPSLFVPISLSFALFFNVVMYRYVITGFLFTAFFTILSARIGSMEDFNSYSAVLMATVLVLLLFYRSYAKFAIKKDYFSFSDSVLIFLRMYVGFNFIPHFVEKLFAGSLPRMLDVQAFQHLGVPFPLAFVILAGMCELLIALSIGLGFFTRAGGIFAVVYLFIATYLGHHFSQGFIWANAGGGFEYPVMWMMLVLIFAVMGANQFSLDALLAKKYNLPTGIKWLMGK